VKSRLFLIAGSVAALALSQIGFAGELSHYHIRVVPRAQQFVPDARPDTNPPPKAALYGLSAAFTATPYPAAANTDTSELWPCFGNTTNMMAPIPNPDCASIGSPSVNFPTGGVAVGVPQYVWSLAACNGATNGSSKGSTPRMFLAARRKPGTKIKPATPPTTWCTRL
jgi:hypothetical protein